MDESRHQQPNPPSGGVSPSAPAASGPSSDKRLAMKSIGAGLLIVALVLGLIIGLTKRMSNTPDSMPNRGAPSAPQAQTPSSEETDRSAPGIWQTKDVIQQARPDLQGQDKNRVADMVRQFKERPPSEPPSSNTKPEAAAPKVSLADATVHAARDLEEPAGQAYDPQAGPLEIKAQALANNSPEAQSALDVLKRYQQAQAREAKSAFVLRPERAAPRMLDYYETQHGSDPTPGRLLRVSQMMIGDSQVLHLEFACPQQLGAIAVANFHRTRSGGLRLDWESFVAYSAVGWADFRQRRSAKPALMRACATLDDYYNYEFADSGRFLSVKLRSPDGEHYVNGFCPRSTPLGRALGGLLGAAQMQGPSSVRKAQPLAKTTNRRLQRVTVVLAFPVTAQSDHCVEIKNFVAPRWLLFDGEE